MRYCGSRTKQQAGDDTNGQTYTNAVAVADDKLSVFNIQCTFVYLQETAAVFDGNDASFYWHHGLRTIIIPQPNPFAEPMPLIKQSVKRAESVTFKQPSMTTDENVIF